MAGFELRSNPPLRSGLEGTRGPNFAPGFASAKLRLNPDRTSRLGYQERFEADSEDDAEERVLADLERALTAAAWAV